MKQLYLFSLLALLCLRAAAQTHPFQKSDFQVEVDRRIANLNKSQIPSGILYDRVLPLARLDVFNQRALPDTSSISHFGQVHYELYNASYTPPAQLNPDTLNARIATFKRTDVIPIGVLYYNFHKIDTLAVSDNLLSVSNDLFYDVPGRSRSPYLSSWAFAVSPMIESAQTGTVSFKLPSNLVIKNTSLTVNRVEVTGGDNNTTITLTPNGNVASLYYGTSGEKVLKFRMVLSNNTSRITYGKLKLLGTAPVVARVAADGIDYEKRFAPCYRETIYSTESFRGYKYETVARVGTGEVYYYYANGKSCTSAVNKYPSSKVNVTKPIIVLDGFDPGDKRGAAEIYGKYLQYDSSNGIVYLGQEMQRQGYDVIILNFPSGADYIERNAFVLITLIDQVNAQLAMAGSNEKITIIGPSMGGLISRYALTLMEKRGNVHNTKLWISFDSPHLGANIPIGDQWMLNYLAPIAGGPRAALEEQINSPAAKQMLLHHYTSNSQSVTSDSDGFRVQFKSALESNGLPNAQGFPSGAIRKIALVNGSQSGNLQPSGSPCGTALEMEIKKTVLSRVLLFFWANTGVTSKLITTRVAFAPSANNTCKVFEGASVYPFGIPISGRDRFAQAINSGASIDLAPGGTYASQAIIRNEGADVGLGAFIKVNFSNVVEKHSFIPTKSALAFKWNNQSNVGDWGEKLSNRNLVCSGEIPFDAYYAPVQNEEHVFLSEQGANFVLNEINGNQMPNTGSFGATVQGPPNICGTETFELTNVPPGVSVTWQASPTSFFTVASGTGNLATLQKSNVSTSGQATVSFTITPLPGNNCISKETVHKTFLVGSNTAQISSPYDLSCYCQIYGPEVGKTYQFYAITNNPSTDPADYLWTVIPNTGTPEDYPMQFMGKSIYFSAHATGYYTFRLKQYISGCGWSTESEALHYFSGGSGGWGMLQVYPNPADDQLTVSFEPTTHNDIAIASSGTTSSMPIKVFEAKLLNSQGKVLVSGRNSRKSKSVVLKTKNIPNGTYILHIQDGQEVIKQQVVIKH